VANCCWPLQWLDYSKKALAGYAASNVWISRFGVRRVVSFGL